MKPKKRESDFAEIRVAAQKRRALREMPGLEGADPTPADEATPSTPAQPKPRARAPPAMRLLDRREVLAIVGCSYTTLWEMMQTGEFPRGRIRGGKTMWLSDEVEQWMRQLPVRPLKGDVA